MEVLILLIFVSLMLVVLAVGFFAWNLSHKSHEHVEHLSLLPLSERGEIQHETGTAAKPMARSVNEGVS